jgi:DNA-binding MarR family transcriptional regulator
MIAENKRDEASANFFEELKDTFFFQIHRMQKAFFRHSNHLMQQSGIDLQVEQFPVLMTIHAMKKISQQEIANIIMRDKSSVLRSVVALQKKGLLYIRQDDADKRRHIISLSLHGVALAKKTKLLIRKAETEAFAAFSLAERSLALQSVRHIADKLEKL